MKPHSTSKKRRVSKRKRRRGLLVERLEGRSLLAGVIEPLPIAVQAEGEAPVPRTIYLENFESGLGGYTADNTGGTLPGLWHHSLGRRADGLTPHSPISSMYYGLFETASGGGRYDTLPFDHQGVLISPAISLPAGVNTLMFNSFLNTRLPVDIDFVDVSVVSVTPGSVPVQLVSRADGSLVQTSNSWQSVMTELPSQFSNSTIQLRFTFDTGDTVNIDPEGWYVDDVKITNVANNDLSVTKVVDDPTPNEGQLIEYMVTASNAQTSDGTATGVIVTEPLPAGLTLVSEFATEGDYDPATGLWTGLELDKGETQTLTITATVNAGTAGVALANTVMIMGNDNDPNPGDNTFTQTSTVNSVDLSVTKTVDDDTPNEGQTITYTIVAANSATSNATATGVVVTDILPAGVTLDPSSITATNPTEGSFDPSTGRWTGLELLKGESQTLKLTVSVNAGTAGTQLVNTASIAGNETDPDPNSNTVTQTSTVNHVDLIAGKMVGDSTPNEKDELTYTITVTNPSSSNAPATNVVINDVLPTGLTFVSSDRQRDPGGTDQASTWTIPAIAAGGTVTITMVASVDVGTCGDELTNNMTVVAAETDPNTDNNKSAASVIVNCVDLSVTKTADDTTPNVGQSVEYKIVVTNPLSSNASATGITVSEVLPTGLNLDPAKPPTAEKGTFDTDTLEWKIPEVERGKTVTLTVFAIIGEDSHGTSLANTACAELAETDPDTINNCSTAVVTVNSVDLQIAKAIDNPSPTAGDVVIYTITATNPADSNADATNIVVTESLPTGFTIVSSSSAVGSVDPSTGQWSGFALEPGQTAEMKLAVRIGNDVGAGLHENVAVGSSSESDPDPSSNTAAATADVASLIQFVLPISSFRPDGNSLVTPISTADTTISGFNWLDVDGDGVWDAEEPVRKRNAFFIDLNNDGTFDPNENEPVAVTGDDGRYVFTGLADGTPLADGDYLIRDVDVEFSAGTTRVQTFPAPADFHKATITGGVSVSGAINRAESPNFGDFEYVPFIRPSDNLPGHLESWNRSGATDRVQQITDFLSPWQTISVSNTTDADIVISSVEATQTDANGNLVAGDGLQFVSLARVDSNGDIIFGSDGNFSEPGFMDGSSSETLQPGETRKYLALYDPAIRNVVGDQVISQSPNWLGTTTGAHSFASDFTLVLKTDGDDTADFRVRMVGGSTFDSDIFYDGSVDRPDFDLIDTILDAGIATNANDAGFDLTTNINTRCPNGSQQIVGACSWAIDGVPTREIGLGDFGTLNVEFGRARSPWLDLDGDNSSAIGLDYSTSTAASVPTSVADVDAVFANNNALSLTSLTLEILSPVATDQLEFDPNDVSFELGLSAPVTGTTLDLSMTTLESARNLNISEYLQVLNAVKFETQDQSLRTVKVRIIAIGGSDFSDERESIESIATILVGG